MHSFTDTQGREWHLSISVATVDEIAKSVTVKGRGLDLLAGDDGLEVIEAWDSPRTLASTLYVICRQQCEAQEISPEEFASGLAGDVIDSATEALLNEYSDFFPARRRSLFTATKNKANEAMQTATSKVLERIEALDLTDLIEKEMKRLEEEQESTSGNESLSMQGKQA